MTASTTRRLSRDIDLMPGQRKPHSHHIDTNPIYEASHTTHDRLRLRILVKPFHKLRNCKAIVEPSTIESKTLGNTTPTTSRSLDFASSHANGNGVHILNMPTWRRRGYLNSTFRPMQHDTASHKEGSLAQLSGGADFHVTV